MINELDLAFDEPTDRRRHRGRRRSGSGGGGGRGKSSIALLMAFVLLGVLAGGAYYGFDRIKGFFTVADYEGPGTGETTVQVVKSSTITDIGNALVEADVIESTAAFVEAAKDNSRSENIQPGFYKVRKQMKASDALAMLLDLKNKVSNKITIPEGRSSFQVFALLAEATKLPVKDFEDAAKDPEALGVPDFWFKRDDGKEVVKSIEGFLFPETYELDPGLTATQILEQMVTHFLTVADELQFVERVEAERKITPYEALIVASLAEAEAGTPGDIAKVARVAYNRLYLDSSELACKCLSMDVTINYSLELAGKPIKESKALTQAELDDGDNVYNTHVNPGLPPTPINSPGKAGLQGAMEPAAGKWFFFVAIDKKGNSAFSETFAEHQRNETTARENGVL